MKSRCKAGFSSEGFGFWFSSSSRDQGEEGREDRGRGGGGKGSGLPQSVSVTCAHAVFTHDGDRGESFRGGRAEEGRRETREKKKE